MLPKEDEFKYNFLILFIISFRAEELANFLAAPAPDFFSKRLRLRLRLLVFFSSGSGSKEPKTPGSDRLLLPSPSSNYPNHLPRPWILNMIHRNKWFNPPDNIIVWSQLIRLSGLAVDHIT